MSLDGRKHEQVNASPVGEVETWNWHLDRYQTVCGIGCETIQSMKCCEAVPIGLAVEPTSRKSETVKKDPETFRPHVT